MTLQNYSDCITIINKKEFKTNNHGGFVAKELSVKIECSGSTLVSLKEIKPIQGNLKDLSEENYNKLRSEILENGFSAPFFIWGKFILDGTQRHRTLKKMSAEGVDLPDRFPAVEIHATSKKQAMTKLLSYISQYGEMTKDGLYEFMSEHDFDIKEIKERFRFTEIPFENFEDEFYKEESEPEKAGDIEKKYILQIELPNELELRDLYDDLISKGFLVKEL